MKNTISAQIPSDIEQMLAEYCVRTGCTRSVAMIQALRAYLDPYRDETSTYALAADLIPRKGTQEIQSMNVRGLARAAFHVTRNRRKVSQSPLLEYRAARGMNQSELAKILDCSRSLIGLIETGARPITPLRAKKWQKLTGIRKGLLCPKVFG